MAISKHQYQICYVGLMLCLAVLAVIFVYWNTLMPRSENNVDHLKRPTISDSRWIFLCNLYRVQLKWPTS